MRVFEFRRKKGSERRAEPPMRPLRATLRSPHQRRGGARGPRLSHSPGPAAGEGTNQEQVSRLSPFLLAASPRRAPLSFRERFALIFK